MFGKLDLTKEIKIPKGIVSMLKSFGLDAKELEQHLLKMGKDVISILEHAEQRITALGNQHQLLHDQMGQLRAEVFAMHNTIKKLEEKYGISNGVEQQPVNGD